MMLRALTRFAFATVLILLGIVAPSAYAQTPAPGTAASSPATGASSAAATSLVKSGEVAAGNKKAIDKITALFSSVMDTAVTASQAIRSESDKFAGGLAIITIVLAAIRFAAAKHPVMAWVALFEELGMLGIFAAFYVGFAQWAPGFYKWFLSLANDIGGANMSSSLSIMGNAAGQIFDSVIKAYSGVGWSLSAVGDVIVGTIPLLAAWLLMSITAIVFAFFINIGQLQFAAGVVMGQVAFALGFSSFTRGYFKTWLDYMISAGMYVVVAAILMRLVTGSMVEAVKDAAGLGLSTSGAAGYVFDLAFFVFLLSFEIPKIAGMFGGGASASGAMIGKVAKSAVAMA
jgi:TrbL/VirB6 plasmid conjugal transfer protein